MQCFIIYVGLSTLSPSNYLHFSLETFSIAMLAVFCLVICSLSTLSSDMVCIVEPWLSRDICDSELSLPGFSIFHLDHNHQGGGILVYVKSSLSPSVISYKFSQIELLLLPIKIKTCLVH